MKIRDKARTNKTIDKILSNFLFKPLDEETLRKISYEIKCFLEKENINFETINLYTPPERVDKGLIDIRIDDELYPLKEK